MEKSQAAPPLPANQLLARLLPEEYQRLLPLLRLVPLDFRQSSTSLVCHRLCSFSEPGRRF